MINESCHSRGKSLEIIACQNKRGIQQNINVIFLQRFESKSNSELNVSFKTHKNLDKK